MRKLKHNVQVEVVGFPVGFASTDIDGSGFDEKGPRRRSVLYIAGNNFETTAAKLIHEAFGEFERSAPSREAPSSKGSKQEVPTE